VLQSAVLSARALRVAGQPARVAGTRICGRVREPAELCVLLRVGLNFGARLARDKEFFVRVTEC